MRRRSGCCSCDRPSSKTFGVELLVVVQTAFTVLSVLVTYILAEHYDHVKSFLPFISEAGAKGFERCLFSFCANTSSILSLIVIYTRFKQISYLHIDTVLDNTRLNVFSLVCGILSGLGLLIVANFQLHAVYYAHVVGAWMLFVFGVFYEWSQTVISYKVYKTLITKHFGVCVLWLRLLIAMASTILIIVFAVAAILNNLFTYVRYQDLFYLMATSTEWGLIFSFLLFYLTFHNELAKISVNFSIRQRYNTENIITSSYLENTPLTI